MTKHPLAVCFFVGCVVGAALTAGSCDDSSRRSRLRTRGLPAPTSPTPAGVPPKPSGPTYTISGTVTEYRRGPLSGADIFVDSCHPLWGIRCDTQTDAQGRYTIESLSMEPTALGARKPGYQVAWWKRVSAQDATASFVLHPSVPLSAFGSTITGTIAGEEFQGDAFLFGALCSHTPCKVMKFDGFIGAPRQTEVRLRWADSTHQLALYKLDGDPDSGKPALRYCCSTEIVETISVSGYFDAIAVAFEQAGGQPPAPSDSETFELTVRPFP